MSETVLRALKEVRERLKESLFENDRLRIAIDNELSKAEARQLIAELGWSVRDAKKTLKELADPAKLPLSKMMMYLTRGKQENEVVARENLAIVDVLASRSEFKPRREEVQVETRTALDDKHQKVMDVFKEKKEHQENGLKEKLRRLKEDKSAEEDVTAGALVQFKLDGEKPPGWRTAGLLSADKEEFEAVAELRTQLIAETEKRVELQQTLKVKNSEMEALNEKLVLVSSSAGSGSKDDVDKDQLIEVLQEKVRSNRVALENLVESVQEARTERDEARDKVKKLGEMLKVMEELQEELTGSMNPTIKTLTNLREVVKSQEAEIDQKDKEIARLQSMAHPGADLLAEKVALESKVTELSTMVMSQAAKLQEYKEIMSTDLIAAVGSKTLALSDKTPAAASDDDAPKPSAVAIVEKKKAAEIDALVAQAAKSSSSSLSSGDILELMGVKTSKKVAAEAEPAEAAAEVKPAEAAEPAPAKQGVDRADLDALRKELEDERDTRKQLAATLMSIIGQEEQAPSSSWGAGIGIL